MALNQHKLVSIIVDEAGKLPERCGGYRKAVIETLGEIMDLERRHQSEGIYVKQRIADQCNALGRHLWENRSE